LDEDGETMGDGSAKPAPPKSVHAQQEQRAGRAKCAADLDGVQPVGSPAPVERDLALAEEGNRTGRCHESIGSWESTSTLRFWASPAIIFERHSRSRERVLHFFDAEQAKAMSKSFSLPESRVILVRKRCLMLTGSLGLIAIDQHKETPYQIH
jgi:hypothetical protein